MSNSKLVNYKRWSPFYSNRNGAKIDRIAIHHMAGNLSIETCGEVFQTRRASATYGVGTDGRVGQYVDEAYAPWTTSNYYDCDRYAVTIEVANDQVGGDWHISDKALQKTIDLCVDVCKRNGIKKLNFTGDKSGNLLQHRWFDATACPGPYLASKFEYIADQTNAKLLLEVEPEPVKLLDEDGLFGEESIKALQSWLYVPFTPDGEISGQRKDQKKYFPNIVNVSYEGTGSQTVQLLQDYLTTHGFDCGGSDGLLGKDTVTAWQKWLIKNGYSVGDAGADGVFGSESAIAMQKYLNQIK